jgi:malate dehydrogenase (oxaloacetate-decarboxylating)
MYMGRRHKRINQEEYNEFVDIFIQAVKRRWPHVLLQFEDFAQPNATPLLIKYRDQICCFNDDIQGTASVTVGTLLAACRIKGRKLGKETRLSQQKVVFVGSGSAGCGIAEQIIAQMISEGISAEQARSQIFMVDRFGLLTDGMADLRDFQQKLVQSPCAISSWNISGRYATLLEVMDNAKADILIGVSGVPGLFTEHVIKAMKSHCPMPIIFPLSNPIKQVEATPEQVINWTEGEVIVATGSPFKPVEYQGKIFPIVQCNNSYIFPGLGLGIVASNINRVTDEMLMVASETLAEASPLANTGQGELLPPLTEIASLSRKIAFAVAKVAFDQNLALRIDDASLLAKIERNFWKPEYRKYRRSSV